MNKQGAGKNDSAALKGCRTIAVCNQAGGVGKSTITRDLGHQLSTGDKRVLLIDADSQGSLGEFLGLRPHEREDAETFWHAVCSEGNERPAVTQAFGVSVGIANLGLIRAESRLAEQKNPMRFFGVLKKLAPDFDFVLIDCPPHISEMTVQILCAADEILIPVQTEAKAVWGLAIIQEEIAKSNRRRDDSGRPPLRVTGIVPTLYNPNRKLHAHYLSEIQRMAGVLETPVFTPFRDYIAVSEACNAGQPLKMYAPNCPANVDMAELAASILGE